MNRMISIATIAAGMVTALAGADISESHVVPKAYVYSFDPRSDLLVGSRTYNASGQTVRARNDPSTFTVVVTFPGLGPFLRGNPHHQVTPAAPGNGHRSCFSHIFGSIAQDVELTVRCTRNGQPAFVPFNAFVVDRDSDVAYLRVNENGSANEGFNPWGSGTQRSYNAVGRKTVRVLLDRALPPGVSALAGVTPADPSAHCQIFDVDPTPTSIDVMVDCYNSSGTLRDTTFRLLVMKSSYKTGFVLRQFDNTPSPELSSNDSGGAIQLVRNGTGDYTVSFLGLSPYWIRDGSFKVNAYGAGGHSCSLNVFDRVGTTVQASVHCYAPGGAPADTRFTLLAVTAF
jgi:hypothetical protein